MKKTKFKQTEIGMIPEDWELTKVGLKCKIKNGKTNSQDAVENGIFPLFDRSSQIKRSNKFLFDCEAIIVPGEGKEFNPRYFKGKFDLHQRAYAIWTERENIDLKFVYYWILKNRNYLTRIAVGSTVKSLRLNHLENFPLGLPNPKEQRAIAKILSDLDSKIELLQKQNETLEKIGQAIFKHWFVDFEFPNEEGKPYKSSGGEMVYNEELGKEIPKEWSVGSLGDGILTRLIKSGINNFDSEKIYLDTASVQDTNIIDFSTRITINKRPSRANMQPIPKSVWFAKMKNSKKVLLIDEYDKFILNKVILSTGFAGIETLKNSEYYIWNIINSDNFEKIKDSLCLGTTMQAINNENIKKIKYLIPQYELLIKFNNFVKENYKKISINKQQIQTLQQIRDSLLPKLMTGKIRVPVEVIK